MSRKLPKTRVSTKVNHDWPGHVYMVGKIYGRGTFIHVRELFDRMGIDYENNGNKRALRMFRRVKPLLRRRPTNDGTQAYEYGMRYPELGQYHAKRISKLPLHEMQDEIDRTLGMIRERKAAA